jgi:kynurenine 3-monooxygenase
MIHPLQGGTELHRYGKSDEECIYSIGRAALNLLLIEAAARSPRVRLNFEHRCVDVDPQTLTVELDTGSERITRASRVIFGTDGAGSAVRTALERTGLARTREDWLDHDYKELTIPPRVSDGAWAFAPDALHIWPRGGYMLIALPNPDRSFTATLFLPRKGPVSFEALDSADQVSLFFRHEFPDAAAAMPQIATDFSEHPQGRMASVHCTPWALRRPSSTLLLLGDAAHAIVPFHGQGMNAAFEDCLELCMSLDSGHSLPKACMRFESERRAKTEAIAEMAIENYVEMRDTVRDPAFVRQKALAAELERRYPERFIPRYSMVMFHPEISYAEAQRRGAIQSEILGEIDSGILDAAQAEAIIYARLPPVRSSVTKLME